MNQDSLYLKYRPKSLDEMKGNRTVIDSISGIISNNKIPHAILLTGPSGCGKTTVARIIKDALGCHDQDYRELDSAVDRSVDGIREIRRQMTLKALGGKVRVWLIDECHILGVGGASASNASQNALLKALEDTPSHVYFILATTDPQKLLQAIKTRCMTFNLSALNSSQMLSLLDDVIEKEKLAIADDIKEMIINQSMGSPRQALNILQKVSVLPSKQQAKAVEQATSEENQVIDLCRSLIKHEKWTNVVKILRGLQDQEPETIRRAVLGYCNSVILNNGDAQAYLIMDAFKYNTYDIGWPAITMACYELTELRK